MTIPPPKPSSITARRGRHERQESPRHPIPPGRCAICRRPQGRFCQLARLATHVSELRAMEGTWNFAALEIDGAPMEPYGIQPVAIADRRRPFLHALP